MALKQSVLNRSQWVDWIFLYSDEAEAYYSGLDMDMDTQLNAKALNKYIYVIN